MTDATFPRGRHTITLTLSTMKGACLRERLPLKSCENGRPHEQWRDRDEVAITSRQSVLAYSARRDTQEFGGFVGTAQRGK